MTWPLTSHAAALGVSAGGSGVYLHRSIDHVVATMVLEHIRAGLCSREAVREGGGGRDVAYLTAVPPHAIKLSRT